VDTSVVERQGVLVRPATLDDLDWLVIQLKDFSDFFASELPLFPTDEFARKGITDLIQKHLVLIAYDRETGERMGLIAGVVTPHLFNPDITVLAETFWWVPEEHRGTRAGAILLDAFIAWGKRNADWITIALESRTPIKETSLLKRGFRLQERSYLCEVI